MSQRLEQTQNCAAFLQQMHETFFTLTKSRGTPPEISQEPFAWMEE